MVKSACLLAATFQSLAVASAFVETGRETHRRRNLPLRAWQDSFAASNLPEIPNDWQKNAPDFSLPSLPQLSSNLDIKIPSLTLPTIPTLSLPQVSVPFPPVDFPSLPRPHNFQWQLPTGFSDITIPDISAILPGFQQRLDGIALPDSLPPTTVVAATATVCVFTAVYMQSFEDNRAGKEPYRRGLYDPIQARAYYARNRDIVLQRALQMLRLSNKFVIGVLLDKYVWKNEERNRPRRAEELLKLLQELGPTAIKIGQALSVRPDLIPEEYANKLSSLQDAVPPFSTVDAQTIVSKDFNTRLPSEPIASASIGQVYKTTYDGRDVAIKVQRPAVLAQIALDLYIVREIGAPVYQRFTRTATDYVSLANEWGRGFIAELDYGQEAAKTTAFSLAMKERNLDAVCAPTVVAHTEQVLITEWIEGTRLDQSTEDDIPRLCAVALNAYLCMLLELQSLHCDPHPGNLLRTTDGRLCILDWGMTLELDSQDLQYNLLQYVAHLTANDYDELPLDLVRLGFLKEEKLEFVKRSGVLEPLKYFLKQAGQGGGATAVRERIFDEYRAKYPGKTDDELRVEMRSEMKQQIADMAKRESVSSGITTQVEDLQKRNADSFLIPEWFLYTSRAFLTLEGVSLQADENYSIIQSCFPYVAKRLVGDDDPRARKALRDLIYGASGVVDVDRLTDLADGFSSYTTTSKAGNSPQSDRISEAESTITLVKDSADVLLAPEGNVVQSLLVEESALAASASFKDSVRETFLNTPKRLRETLPFGNILPPLPFEEQVRPFVAKSPEEVKAQELAEKVISLVPRQEDATDSASSFVQNLRELEPEQAAMVLKEVRENLPTYAPLVGDLGSRFVSKLLATANDNIENTLEELEEQGKSPDPVFRATVQGFSRAAERGASALEREQETPTR